MTQTSDDDDPPALPLIPDSVEAAVLDILDTSDTVAERDRRLAVLCEQNPTLETSIRLWLADLDAPLSSETGSLAPGREFGAYSLLLKLGAGGMGVVYLALDRRLGRKVAIKILPSHRLADESSRQRFEREAKAVAALSHAAIVPVFEVGEVDGVPYFTMEYVAGRSLDAVIADLRQSERSVMQLTATDLVQCHLAAAAPKSDEHGRVSAASTRDEGAPRRSYQEAVCRLIIDIADALEHAHQHSVVHRDVKPSNMIAAEQGGAKLFDFGLAWLEGSLAVTQTSDLLGSPCYMSPEQVSKRSQIDGRSDVYSLGVTLYELLTLQLPFPDRDLEKLLQRILKSEPAPIRKANPNVGRDLETICLTAMDKVPARRYQTAQEMGDDLRRFLRFEPVMARPVSSVTRSLRWLHRHPALVAIVLLVQVVSIVLLLVFYFAGQLLILEPKLEQSMRTLETRKAEEKQKNQLISEQTAKIRSGKAELQELVHQFESKGRALEAQRNELAREKLRLIEALQSAEAAEHRLKSAEAKSKNLDSELAQNRLTLANLLQDRERLIAETGTLRGNRLLAEAMKELRTEPGLGLAIAADAATEVPGVLADNTLLELLIACREIREFGDQENVIGIDVSPDGRRIVTISAEHGVRVWDTESGKLVTERVLGTVSGSRSPRHVEFATDRLVLLADEQRSLYLLDLESEDRPARIPSARHYAGGFRHTSPDRRVFVARISHRLNALGVWDLRAGVMQPKLVLDGHSGVVRDLSFSPRGRYLVTSAGDARACIWDLARGTESDWLTQPSRALCVDFADHAHEIVVLDTAGHLKIWDISRHREIFSFDVPVASSSSAARVEFAARDRNLVVELGHSTLVVSRRERRVIRRIDHSKMSIGGLSLGRGVQSPDGRVWVERTEDGALGVWDTLTGDRLADLRGHQFGGASSRSLRIAFVPGGHRVATCVGYGSARLWSLARGGRLVVCDMRQATGLKGSFGAAGYDATGQKICAITHSGALTYWDAKDGACLGVERSDAHEAWLGAFDVASGRTLTVREGLTRVHELQGGGVVAVNLPQPELPVRMALWSAGNAVQVTMPRDGQRRMTLLDKAGGRRSLLLPKGLAGGGVPVFSPNGESVLTGYRELGMLRLSGAASFRALPSSERPAVFSPGGAYVLTSLGFGAGLWRVDGNAPVIPILSGGGAESTLACADFSADQTQIATGWSDGLVCLHDVATGRRLVAKRVHRGVVLSVDLAPGGSRLLVAGADNSVAVLNCGDLQSELAVPDARAVVGAVWNPGGSAFLVIQESQLWVVPLDVLGLARTVLPRDLTAEEKLRYALKPGAARAGERVSTSAQKR